TSKAADELNPEAGGTSETTLSAWGDAPSSSPTARAYGRPPGTSLSIDQSSAGWPRTVVNRSTAAGRTTPPRESTCSPMGLTLPGARRVQVGSDVLTQLSGRTAQPPTAAFTASSAETASGTPSSSQLASATTGRPCLRASAISLRVPQPP